MRNVGGVGISRGNRLVTAESAVCTCRAAASILRPSANCTVMLVDPVLDDEVVRLSPGIVDSCGRTGVSTDHPVRACLASQYAGWMIQEEKYFAMGSGPMRAAYGHVALVDRIG